MSNQNIIRRRVLGSKNKCAEPGFYVAKDAAFSGGTVIYTGRYFDWATMYFFATGKTSGATLHWTIKIYNSSGTQQGSYTGTAANISATTPTRIGSSSGYSIPSGGSVQVSGYFTKTNVTASNTVTCRIYRTKQTLTVSITANGPNAGYYRMITINSTPPQEECGCNIYYTINSSDGTPSTPADPTTGSTPYSGMFIVTKNTKIKAKAFDTTGEFNNSTVALQTIKISKPALTAPTIAPAGGSYSIAQVITIENPNTVGDIHYTTDGTAPTINSPIYPGPFTIGQSMTLKAIVIEPYSMISSLVNTQGYTISNEPALTVTYSDFTEDSTVVHATLTYDINTYKPLRSADGPYIDHALGFYIITPGGEVPAVWHPVWVNNTDLNRPTSITYNNPYSGVINIDYEFHVTKSYQDEYGVFRGVQAMVDMYYLDIDTYTIHKRSIYSNTIWDPNPGERDYRGTYAITSGSITGQTYNVQSNKQYNISVVFSPINLSFHSQFTEPNKMKHWGGDKRTIQRHTDIIDEPVAPVDGTITSDPSIFEYETETDFLRSPWSYIGSSERAETGYDWRFGNTNGNNDSIRDLFGYGTSYNKINNTAHQIAWQPWSISTTESDYYTYNSSTDSIRNVRSAVRQTNPAEPNAMTGSDFANPKIYADWSAFLPTVNSLSTITMYARDSGYNYGWYPTPYTSQASKTRYDDRFLCGTSSDEAHASYIADKIGTLSKEEWNYILFERSGSRFAKGRIQCTDYYGHSGSYVNGLFVFSDQTPQSVLTLFSSVNNASSQFTANTISESIWRDKNFENWVIFLPAAGYRQGTTISFQNTRGFYWTRSVHLGQPYILWFSNSSLGFDLVSRSDGCSVRFARYIYTQV